jgi:hypothetical protein
MRLVISIAATASCTSALPGELQMAQLLKFLARSASAAANSLVWGYLLHSPRSFDWQSKPNVS